MADAGRIVGLLADLERRRAFAAVVLGARTIDAVAETARLDPTVTERAIARLVDGGVLDREDGVLDVVADTFVAAAREAGIRARALDPPAPPGPLRGYFRDGRLASIPTKRAAQDALLELLGERFEAGVDYPEKQVNAIVGEIHPDYATLRRLLVDAGRLTRQDGVYRRADP